MPNLLQLINKSTIIEQKAEQIIQSTINDYNHGKVATKTALLYELLVKIKQFYSSANKPLMKRRYALGLPNPTEFNDTMNEALADLSAMVTETDNLLSAIDESYKQVEFNRTRTNNAIRLVESLYTKADKLISELEYNDIFLESFANMDSFDSGGCVNDPVNINNAFGYITLALSDSQDINSMIDCLEILDGSNGFPGNTHQAESVNDNVRFIGEDGVHLELSALTDNNTDTWFEYELYKISQDVYVQTLGMGFNYSEGISWISNADSLKLSIKITFGDSQEMNILSLSPFIPADKDATACSISSIVISDGKGKVNRLVEEFVETFDREKVYLFPKQNVKTIIIEFEHDYAYSTKIGHLYYQEITTDNINYFTQNELKTNKRVNEQLPSSSAVGLIYDDEQQLYVQPKSNASSSAADKSDLFSIPEVDPNIIGAFELLPANRFNISIRDITCENNRYAEISDYVSIGFETKTPLNSISLEADEEIPDIFEVSNIDKDFIRYYISIDNGENWYPIIPHGLYKREGVEKYLINSGIPYEMRSAHIGYIETNSDEHKVKVKIELERPTDIPDSEAYSPIVYSYTLQTI